MIYALAAYSITLGVLALYGVSIQHRMRTASASIARSSASPTTSPTTSSATSPAVAAGTGFNLGAALLAPVWMWWHGMRAAGVVVLVACLALWPLYTRGLWIPFIFLAMVPLAAGAALGFVGNRIAATYLAIADPGALSATQKPWALAGIVLHAFVLPWAFYFAIGTPG